jgi:MFS family permease
VRRWFRDTVGGLPRSFWYLWGNTLISRVGSFVLILLAFYLTQVRGFSPAFAGLVIGLWGAGGAAGTLIGGVLADRWGRKPTLLTALYTSASLMLALGFARGPLVTAANVLLLGLITEASRPPMSALMIDVVGERDRVRASSLNYWVVNVGIAVAAITAGLVARVDFLLLFIIDAASTVAAATLLALKLHEPARARPMSTVDLGRPGLRAVFADKVFLAYVGVNVLTITVFMQHLSTLPIAMAHDGLSASAYGGVIALNAVLIVAGQFFVARVQRGARPAVVLAIASLVMGSGFGLFAFAHTLWLYGVAVLVWTIGEMLNAPSSSATSAALSPVALRGRYQGVFALSWSAAGFLAPVVGAATFQYLGNTALWLGCFGISVIVAALHLTASRARERRAAELRALATDPPSLVGPEPATAPA